MFIKEFNLVKDVSHFSSTDRVNLKMISTAAYILHKTIKPEIQTFFINKHREQSGTKNKRNFTQLENS